MSFSRLVKHMKHFIVIVVENSLFFYKLNSSFDPYVLRSCDSLTK